MIIYQSERCGVFVDRSFNCGDRSSLLVQTADSERRSDVSCCLIVHQAFIDGRIGEHEVIDIFSQWKLGDRQMVLDRSGPLLV